MNYLILGNINDVFRRTLIAVASASCDAREAAAALLFVVYVLFLASKKWEMERILNHFYMVGCLLRQLGFLVEFPFYLPVVEAA